VTAVRRHDLTRRRPRKSEWLPKLATGEVRGGLALTEPDAGTDLQGIRMTARRDGAHYVVNGTNEIQRIIIAKQWLKRNPAR
jgi:alkylation response protein AidB-like acyl-CoA dehydrogenase